MTVLYIKQKFSFYFTGITLLLRYKDHQVRELHSSGLLRSECW
jgi:hypothetical protein